MAYSISLDKRIEIIIKGKRFSRKEMFGGVGYLLNGNMCIGIHKDDLIIRFDPKLTEILIKKKGVKPFAIANRPMKGWLLVNADNTKGSELDKWFDLAYEFVKKLSPK